MVSNAKKAITQEGFEAILRSQLQKGQSFETTESWMLATFEVVELPTYVEAQLAAARRRGYNV